MRPALFFVAILVAAVTVAVFVLVESDPDPTSSAHGRGMPASSPAPVPGTSSGAKRAPSEPSTPTFDAARARHDELIGASPTFRNTTFLIAIRNAGYICADVVDAMQSGDELAGWRVSCRDALAYAVGVDISGALVAEPIPVGEGAPRFRPSTTLEDLTGPDRR